MARDICICCREQAVFEHELRLCVDCHKKPFKVKALLPTILSNPWIHDFYPENEITIILRRIGAFILAKTCENPKPVAVGIVVNDEGKFLVVKRSIEPKIGEWVLPGGFHEVGEEIRVALQREVLQEAHVDVHPALMRDLCTHTTPNFAENLTFFVVPASAVYPYTETNETTERAWLEFSEENAAKLGFDLHGLAVRTFMRERERFDLI